uniref:Uncharacterized protein n=1 Tax=Mesocestoides corti TaxID=53468 RepID=A0A5K3F1D6_MESCO
MIANRPVISVNNVYIVLIFTLFFIEAATAIPKTLEHGLVINRRPELYYAADVVDKAYRLCWVEIQKDILTGRKRRSEESNPQDSFPRWVPIAGGRRYYLPLSEQKKLSIGENCLLVKGIEIARREEGRFLLN